MIVKKGRSGSFWNGTWSHNDTHYDDVIMSAIASQITSLTIVYSTIYPGADRSKHQSSVSLALVWRIHRGPVNSPHKWPVIRKMFPFDDVIMEMFSVLLALCYGNSLVTSRFPSQRAVTSSFDVSFDVRMNKWLNKQWSFWWFEMLKKQ